MAKVAGITKCSNAVYRDYRSPGNYCAKMTTILESVKALGIINMKVTEKTGKVVGIKVVHAGQEMMLISTAESSFST